MKFRYGFVSNSSSTSFTIYGILVDDEDAFEKLTGLTLRGYANQHGLRVEYGDPNGWETYRYLGLVVAGDFEHSYESDMKDGETKKDFKARVDAALPAGLRGDACMHTESFYDG